MRQPQPTPAADRVEFIVRFGWPEFKCKTIQGPAGSDVASVTRSAKILPFSGEGHADTSRWVPFSWEQRRFLAPDEQAPLQFVVGPYEALLREAQPPESPVMAAADRERYEARWETGLRNIVTILHGPRYSFEIGAIVEEVRALAEAASRVPQPSSTTEDRIEFAHRLGNWDFVSLQDIQRWTAACKAGFMSRDDAIRWMGGDPVEVDRKIAEERARAASFGLSYPPVTLVPGNVVTLPPGTEIRSVDTAAPETERDNLGLCLRSADDLAAGYDCRVELVGMDDARFPMSVEHDEGDHIVVTDRHSARVVGLVQAWVSDDGDPIVPKTWLEIVLSAWDAAKEPQQAA